MRTKRIFHVLSLIVLILISACATANRDSAIEPPQQRQCLDTSDCPAGYRCHPKDRVCEKAY